MKRRAILEKHAACIGSMFLHKAEHTYNSMCEATNQAMNDPKTHIPNHQLSLVSFQSPDYTTILLLLNVKPRFTYCKSHNEPIFGYKRIDIIKDF